MWANLTYLDGVVIVVFQVLLPVFEVLPLLEAPPVSLGEFTR